MPRMRTLKPGFFSNDLLAEVHPLGRLLFQGLWCMADREGRLEDRPKKVKAEVLPYDNCNVDKLLDDLAERGFILRYAANGHRYIQVLNFSKHQNPHQKEPASIIPAPDEHSASPVQEQDESDASPVNAPEEPGSNFNSPNHRYRNSPSPQEQPQEQLQEQEPESGADPVPLGSLFKRLRRPPEEIPDEVRLHLAGGSAEERFQERLKNGAKLSDIAG